MASYSRAMIALFEAIVIFRARYESTHGTFSEMMGHDGRTAVKIMGQLGNILRQWRVARS